MAITYKERSDGKINVRLDSKVVGVIVKRDAGFSYRPLGTGKAYGDAFDTLEACKQSLEAA